ncbi:endocuticle structural glycoprotein SgAbd-2-like isoform X2 [Sitophilus oryzae]|uniref:Endocuticle structural glycoprotein SgAbd-2-like isoform X2 n=1 Tax=Sitophilus oryzae TaxID=7048 RepID=A0A6J2XRP1_SITOR|nr:endocuticle structural glycoprotein SgAbd-2-like isoform X2 [Sitophilus oryzae]
MKVFMITLFFCALSYTMCRPLDESRAAITRQYFDINPDGSYVYAFQTENQIFAEEQGYLKEGKYQVKEGQYQYTAPDGQIIRLVYTADENGFHPQGAHLPVG